MIQKKMNNYLTVANSERLKEKTKNEVLIECFCCIKRCWISWKWKRFFSEWKWSRIRSDEINISSLTFQEIPVTFPRYPQMTFQVLIAEKSPLLLTIFDQKKRLIHFDILGYWSIASLFLLQKNWTLEFSFQ